MAVNSNWTDEIHARLLVLAAEGLSGGEIAAKLTHEFGVTFTRNAVIGRCFRNSIEIGVDRKTRWEAKRAEAIKRERARQHGKLASRKPSLAPTASVPDAFPAPKHVPQPKLPPMEAIVPEIRDTSIPQEGLTLLELRTNSCRFPVGPRYAVAQFFCGQPKEGEEHSYCKAHAAVCFQPAPKRKPVAVAEPTKGFRVKKRSAFDLRAQA